MRDERDIATELRDSGGRHADHQGSEGGGMTRDRVVVYARLCTHPRIDIQVALAESERVLKTVLERRLEGGGWMAAVQWSERLCKTFIPHDGPETAAES